MMRTVAALRRLEASGNDLAKARDIDFSVVFPDEASANQFANQVSEHGYTVTVEFAETSRKLPWAVVVVKHMLPSHAAISGLEMDLQQRAERYGGRTDGWDCFSEEA